MDSAADKGEFLWCVSRTWRHLRESTDFIPLTKLTFWRTGANLKLDRSEAALIDSQLQKYWLDEPTRTADFCAAKHDEGPRGVNEPIETLENPRANQTRAHVRGDPKRRGAKSGKTSSNSLPLF